MIFWLLMIPTAVLLGWIYSVAFVAICSLYANLASDFAAWRADVPTNQEQLDRIEQKLDHVIKH